MISSLYHLYGYTAVLSIERPNRSPLSLKNAEFIAKNKNLFLEHL